MHARGLGTSTWSLKKHLGGIWTIVVDLYQIIVL